MFEVDEASRLITESCDPNANIIFGTSIDERFTGEIKITVIATGFDEDTNKNFVQSSSISKVSSFGRKPINEAPKQIVPTMNQQKEIRNS